MAKRRDKLADAIIEREAALRGHRSSFEQLWQQIARYFIPRKATFTEEVSPGIERNRWVLDSTAPRSLELFASFLHTLLNNPAHLWFKLAVPGDQKLNENPEVRRWAEAQAREIWAALSTEHANFYPNAHELYLDVGAFGTGNLFVEAPDNQLRVQSFHLDDLVIDENAFGLVDTVFRRWRPQKRQANQRWPGRELGSKVKDTDRLAFIHAVFPNTDETLADLTKAGTRRRFNGDDEFLSAWVNVEDRITIVEGGYREFPYMIPRWYKVRGEIYGRSPGMTVLPDVRMVNRMMETILRGAEKLVDPPLILPDGGLVSPVRLFPGGLTFSDGQIKPEPLIPPGASRIEYGDALLKQRQEAIREGFFVPLFVTPDSPVKTATQVLQEVDERNRAVSPMLMRMQSELFHRLIFRVYRLLERAGKIAPPPEILGDARVDVEYISPLSASQKQLEALGTLRIVESLLPWAQIDPGVFDAYDPDQVAQVVHAGSGAPSSILRSKSEIGRVRTARREQEAQQQGTQTLIQAIEAGAKVQAAQKK